MPQKVVAHALKNCDTCPKKFWHMSQKVLAHAPKSCGKCSEKSWQMSRKNRACLPKNGTRAAAKIRDEDMMHYLNLRCEEAVEEGELDLWLDHIIQLFGACAPTFYGMCHNYLWHEAYIFVARARYSCGMCHIFL